jgi:5-methyltetrahydrofolate--homocysteine methyltransferase
MLASIDQLFPPGPVVLDGAWGTQLQAQGLGSGECPDAWNLTHPDRVEQVGRAYVAAGSQVILTNTFGANRLRLEGYGLAGKVADINRAGVEISRRATAGKARVFASVGPSGKLLMTGDVTESDLLAVFTEQMTALAAAGADGIVIETMSDLVEAKMAQAAARATGLPVVVSVVFDSGKQKDRTMMGATPEQVATELTGAGADVIGANCGQGIAGYVPVCQRLRSATDRPLWIKANAGLPEMINGQPIYRTTPEQFAHHVPALVQAGARFLGGCCGTNPAFIQALKRALALL